MRFFLHQFRAGPWWRLIPFSLFAAFLLIGATANTPAMTVLLCAVAATVIFLTLYPEMDAAQPYGMTRRQSTKIVIWPVMLTAAICMGVILPQRMDAAGIAGAAASLAVSLFLGFQCLPNGDSSAARAGATSPASARIKGGSFAWALLWRPVLIRAAIFGIITVVVGKLATGISHDAVRQIVAVAPIFVMWLTIIGYHGLLPTTARSFGLTRRAWASHALVVPVVANALFALITVGIALLIDVPTTPYLTASVVGAAACVIALYLLPATEFFSFVLPMLFIFPLRELMDSHAFAFDPEVVRGVALITAVGAAGAVLSVALYVSGRTNISYRSQQFFGIGNR